MIGPLVSELHRLRQGSFTTRRWRHLPPERGKAETTPSRLSAAPGRPRDVQGRFWGREPSSSLRRRACAPPSPSPATLRGVGGGGGCAKELERPRGASPARIDHPSLAHLAIGTAEPSRLFMFGRSAYPLYVYI